MFSLKEFLKKGLLDAVGKMADYKIILNAAGWYDKGVLDDDDLVDIQAEIDKRNFAEEEILPEEAEGFIDDVIGEEDIPEETEADTGLE